MTKNHPYIGFEEYSEHIPASIPAAVQQATGRFVNGRAARVAELPDLWSDEVASWTSLAPHVALDCREAGSLNRVLCHTMHTSESVASLPPENSRRDDYVE